jgi:hypothetical protein
MAGRDSGVNLRIFNGDNINFATLFTMQFPETVSAIRIPPTISK